MIPAYDDLAAWVEAMPTNGNTIIPPDTLPEWMDGATASGIRWHLGSNHVPAVPPIMDGAALVAVYLCAISDDRRIANPADPDNCAQPSVLADAWHLWDAIETVREDYEAAA